MRTGTRRVGWNLKKVPSHSCFPRSDFLIDRDRNRVMARFVRRSDFPIAFLVAASIALLSTVAVVRAQTVDAASDGAVQHEAPKHVPAFGKLPMHFELNRGQTDGQVKFLARGSGYTLFLTPGEAVLSLHKFEVKPGEAVAKRRAQRV